MYDIQLTKHAAKDAARIEQASMKPKAAELLRIIRNSPYQTPPEYEKLKGCKDTYSRRINKQHRLVYQVLPNDQGLKDKNGVLYQGFIKVIRMWTHYE